MTKDEAKNILRIIADLYPKFNGNETVIKAWIYGLRNADYELTQKKLLSHYEHTPYEPKISDIKVIKSFEDKTYYDEIQRDIERNKREKDPRRQMLLKELDRLRSDLDD